MSLSKIILLVNDKLRSEALADLAAADVVERAVGQALLRYGQDKPLDMDGLVEAQTDLTDMLPMPDGWQPGVSNLVSVEYPVGEAPMVTIPALVVHPITGGDRIRLTLDALPLDSQARIHFTGSHAADGSTVPEAHMDAIACLATAELCRQSATRYGFDRDATLNAAGVSQPSQGAELARRAKDWAAQYYAQLGLRNPDQVSAGSSGDAGTGVASAGVVVQPARDGHRRGRFSSQRY
ncbi:hypothetical protein ACFJGW_00600 [Burkholderiaceae bacterium UC74_6]